MSTEEEINKIFEKWERIAKSNTLEPKRITIEEYQDRQKLYKKKCEFQERNNPQPKKKTRAGVAVRLRRQISEAYKLIHITKGQQKKEAITKLQQLKKQQIEHKNSNRKSFCKKKITLRK